MSRLKDRKNKRIFHFFDIKCQNFSDRTPDLYRFYQILTPLYEPPNQFFEKSYAQIELLGIIDA